MNLSRIRSLSTMLTIVFRLDPCATGLSANGRHWCKPGTASPDRQCQMALRPKRIGERQRQTAALAEALKRGVSADWHRRESKAIPACNFRCHAGELCSESRSDSRTRRMLFLSAAMLPIRDHSPVWKGELAKVLTEIGAIRPQYGSRRSYPRSLQGFSGKILVPRSSGKEETYSRSTLVEGFVLEIGPRAVELMMRSLTEINRLEWASEDLTPHFGAWCHGRVHLEKTKQRQQARRFRSGPGRFYRGRSALQSLYRVDQALPVGTTDCSGLKRTSRGSWKRQGLRRIARLRARAIKRRSLPPRASIWRQ